MNQKTKDRILFILGLAACFAVAGLSVLIEKLVPGDLLGASIIALFMGTIIHSFFHPSWIKPALKFTSKKILKLAIILLGASLSVNVIMSVGKMTFFVMLFTFAMCFGGGYFVRKLFKLNWKLSNLISAGTGNQKVNILKILPWFIACFLVLAVLNSTGCIPQEVSGAMKTASKFLMVTALAAIGLRTSITDFKKAGLAPMFYGITIDTLVTLTALAVIGYMGLI